MVAKELYLEWPLEEENSTDQLQDPYEAEETLSLCDLPINSNADDWDDFSREDQSSSSEQDFFEFFSEDFSTASTYPAENIIFCGKLIPYKEPVPLLSSKPHKLETNTKQSHKKKSGLFQWKSDSYTKSKASSLEQRKQRKVGSSKTLQAPVLENKGYSTRRCNDKYDFSVSKVSILTPPVKSRWSLFLFGIARFPTEMELRDIKTRQSRRSPSAMFASFNNSEMVMKKNQSREKGLWGALRALGCKSQQANAVVKASFGCIPRV